MNPLLAAKTLGQRLWLDNLSRTLLREGSLLSLIQNDGIVGLTSNPSIFQKAIESSPYYHDDLLALKASDLNAEARYEQLAIPDIREACDLLAPLQKAGAHPLDGWVSLEVSPALADNTEGTIEAARRLWAAVDKPNLMIKVPATPAGVIAIRQIIAEGINVNVTLLFSQKQVAAVRDAYIDGLADRAANGKDIGRVRSVASVFLSRIDTLVDKKLDAINTPEALALRGKVAVANSKVAYSDQERRYQSKQFLDLQAQGAQPQYLLWASTGTKNAAYPDTLYVDQLIGPNTVNTLPDATLAAFRDHGTAALTLNANIEEARSTYAQIQALGIDMEAVGEQLQKEGLQLFADSFNKLLVQVA